MYKKIISALLLMFLIMPELLGYNSPLFGELTPLEKKALTFGEKENICDLKEEEIPTIFVPGILASWYSEEGFKENKVKRWIPDPITHSYDTLFYTFQQNGYKLKDVFYEDDYNVYIEGNPKSGLYLFGYDWKKDNKLTATLLNQLIYKIQKKTLEIYDCELESVNLIGHSMGGLVSRAMLEDMCISDTEIEYFKNQKTPRNGKLRNPKSVKCKYPFKLNKFITISTPHRGSPRSLPIWENGGIGEVETFITDWALSIQLGVGDDNEVYHAIHGYNKNIPNGIISLGQLLPDIQNKKSFNNMFKYLEKKGTEIPISSYPKNSFLEELNKSENINKLWHKIDKKYYSYYTDLTSNYEKNNIIGLKLNSGTYSDNLNEEYKLDQTEKYKGKDIYDKYSEVYSSYSKRYFVSTIIRDESGLGGDGTVPTANLLLIPNDNIKEINNLKFESKKVYCYDIDNDFNKKENELSLKMGKRKFELCSHTQTPILLSNRILDVISGTKKVIDGKEYKILKDREILIENIGFLKTSENGFQYNVDIGVKTEYENLFKIWYESFFKKGSDKFNKFAHLKFNEGDKRFELKYGSKINGLIRYEVKSPINIIIEDELGRKIGIDPGTGMIINEIPGAWTSGNPTHGTEPEFFLIPSSVKGLHKIKTYGTGDGEYKIEVTDLKTNIDNKKETSRKLVIAGNAKQNIGEDYVVAFSGSQKGYKDITETIPATLEIKSEQYKITDDNFNLRYQIRGNSKEVDNIMYKLYYNDRKISSRKEKIQKNIELKLKSVGEYKVKIFLLDKNGKELNNIESQKEILIKRIKDFSLSQREYPKGEGLEKHEIKALTQKQIRLESYKKKYSNKLKNILSKLDNKKLEKLKHEINSKKEEILSKIKDELKKEKIEFILNEILIYIK